MQTTYLENEIDVRENINNNIPDLTVITWCMTESGYTLIGVYNE